MVMVVMSYLVLGSHKGSSIRTTTRDEDWKMMLTRTSRRRLLLNGLILMRHVSAKVMDVVGSLGSSSLLRHVLFEEDLFSGGVVVL